MDLTELKTAVEEAELVDAHAHNIVAADSTIPFISCFSEATGDALSYAPHSLSFKVCINDALNSQLRCYLTPLAFNLKSTGYRCRL